MTAVDVVAKASSCLLHAMAELPACLLRRFC
jgi:hypothetical protein